MNIAIVGSRDLKITNIGEYIPFCEEIVSGGAKGVDTGAAEYAQNNNLKLTVFLPQYEKYGRAAPIIRNREIVNHADKIIAFWNGKSKGTLSVINYAKKVEKECLVILCTNSTSKI